MGQYFQIHPVNPQQRLLNQAVSILQQGGLIVYPTDSGYALGCRVGDKAAADRIRYLRGLNDHHEFSLVLCDLSAFSLYAKVDNRIFRLLKTLTPGAYTFILKATREVPRRLQNPKRRTIGIRVPDNTISKALLATLSEPLISSTLILPGGEMPLTDPEEIYNRIGNQVELVINGGYCGFEPTTVVDLVEDMPKIIRAGRGDLTPFKARDQSSYQET
ncbi:translation factor Sua5/YciO/YrdC/YwlC [Candidatus Nitrosoglobus terrae]|uniref:Translation factor Sua5/YciO/YrdC/YwlC n=1 Tax=Candidatus Nitrosoglobus terrae TaxID=1630141 RepID=A0A1Q2SLH4_9GAMM|nr:L-threonylcarbamoyladenylate synthase [Candidatus Nitrosoglobus terrae]BAW79996.1 translation factor Sua5/YciO/YrdC/YwlC [Candidatus Nitrosoglobus terrae]